MDWLEWYSRYKLEWQSRKGPSVTNDPNPYAADSKIRIASRCKRCNGSGEEPKPLSPAVITKEIVQIFAVFVLFSLIFWGTIRFLEWKGIVVWRDKLQRSLEIKIGDEVYEVF